MKWHNRALNPYYTHVDSDKYQKTVSQGANGVSAIALDGGDHLQRA